MSTNNSNKVAPPLQASLDLGIEVQKDVNGIEMGVLENGIPFLTQAGLAKLAGVARSLIFTITQEWEEHFHDETLSKDRISFLKEYLFKNGFSEERLYIQTTNNGSVHYAYPDIVCMAILEYYAFESKNINNATAIDNYRRLAAHGLQSFIYQSLDYTPQDKWKYHNDRVSLLQNTAPLGHFIIFNEINGLIVDLITNNLTVNHKTIPDISVGRTWSDYWTDNQLASKYGDRIKYEHNYPTYYPQSDSNPQKPWAYPDSSLPEFRKWFRSEYLPTRFPKYILTKAKLLPGGTREAERIAAIYDQKKLS